QHEGGRCSRLPGHHDRSLLVRIFLLKRILLFNRILGERNLRAFNERCRNRRFGSKIKILEGGRAGSVGHRSGCVEPAPDYQHNNDSDYRKSAEDKREHKTAVDGWLVIHRKIDWWCLWMHPAY